MYSKPDERYPDNWNKLRRYIFSRDKYKCRICGRTTKHPQCHHIVPVGRGGSHHPNNLITVCRRCHKNIHHIL